MGKLIKFLVVVLVLFSVSAGISWYLQSMMRAEDSGHSSSGHGSSSHGSSSHGSSHGSSGGHGSAAKSTPKPASSHGSSSHGGSSHGSGGHGSSSHGSSHGSSHAAPKAEAPKSEIEPGKSAFRPPQLHDANIISGMAANLKQQAEAIRQRENQLTTRQKNLDLIYQDIENQKAAIDELRKEITGVMKELDERLDKMDKKSREQADSEERLKGELRQIKQSLLEVESVEAGRIKQMSMMYDTMEAEAAAQTFQQMVESGKTDMAVKILAGMRERQAAKILASLPSQAISVQLLDRLKTLKSVKDKTP